VILFKDYLKIIKTPTLGERVLSMLRMDMKRKTNISMTSSELIIIWYIYIIYIIKCICVSFKK